MQNDVNRLHFMKFEKIAKHFFRDEKLFNFFFSKYELDKQCCLFESKQAKIFLFISINKCQCNQRMMST
jgi:hypothetical protein